MSFVYSVCILVGVAVIWSVASYLPIINLEEPSYKIISKEGAFEIRSYDPYLAAHVRVSGDRNTSLNSGFMPLADFIFGNNTSQSKIAMTAPVTQTSEKISMTAPVTQTTLGSENIVEFSMPSKYDRSSLPVPNNDQVEIVDVPARKMLVYGFSWWSLESRVNHIQQKLLQHMNERGYETKGAFVYAGYNPPLSAPWMRRNEVMIEIQ